jgi:hypothetical protein
MVLTARHGLGVALLAALAAAAAACNHSLFDNLPGGTAGSGSDAGSDGPGVPASCPQGCLGDAAADFDGSDTGTTHVWRYLEDQGRSWKAMTLGSSTMMGQIDPANRIATCKTRSDAPACGVLRDALLMSSGATSQVDPAIEFTTPRSMPPQVIQLILHAYLASGAAQTIRIYRNSREDLLFTSPLTATNRVDQAVVVDALPGDRFLVAISGDPAASEVGVQFYVNATGQPFPNSCQLALSFTGVDTTTTTTVQDPCSKYTSTSFVFNPQSPMPATMPVPFLPDPGPYPEQKPAISIGQGMFLRRDGPAPMNALDWSHDITVQLWARPTMLGSLDAFLYADFDVDSCGGVALSVRATGGIDPRITLHGCTDPVTKAEAEVTPAFPMDSAWHFVRVVHAAAGFDLCIDGAHVANLPVNPGAGLSTNPPVLGKPVVDDQGALYVGGFDDVRAFAGALPCR